MKKISCLFILFTLFTHCYSLSAQTTDIAKIKAILLLNFIKLSDHRQANNAEEYIVGIYKDEQVQQELSKICANCYHGKPVVIKQITDLQTPVHLLFVPEQNTYAFLSFVKKHGNIANTLIVTDTKTDMSLINFEVNNKLFRFRLNNELLSQNGILLSASIREIAINANP